MENDKQRLKRIKLSAARQHGVRLSDAVWLISQVEQRQWIPVSERLPEIGETVLAFEPVDGVEPAQLQRRSAAFAADGWWDLQDEQPSRLHNVTHWMPLPNPPQEDRDA